MELFVKYLVLNIGLFLIGLLGDNRRWESPWIVPLDEVASAKPAGFLLGNGDAFCSCGETTLTTALIAFFRAFSMRWAQKNLFAESCKEGRWYRRRDLNPHGRKPTAT